VLLIVATMTGCTLAEADEARRALGDPDGQDEVRAWFVPTALGRRLRARCRRAGLGGAQGVRSFGFCKAHAAAFALPTYQSAGSRPTTRRRSWPVC
jgi:error-prone DNA polymerase